MRTFPLICTTDHDLSLNPEVATHSFCEIPVQGPDAINLWVILTGIAIPDFDSDRDLNRGSDTLNEEFTRFDLYIITEYRLRDTDRYLDIHNENKDLLQATTVSLASIQSDDDTSVIFAIDSAETFRDGNGRLQIHVRLASQGDMGISRVSYQANVLLHREK